MVGVSAMAAKANPMPPTPINEIFCLKVEGEIEGCQTICTFYYRNDKLPGTATITDLIGVVAAFTAVGAPLIDFAACCTTDWVFKALHCYSPTKESLLTYTYTAPGPGGAAAPPALANQSAVTIAKGTLWRGKHGRGRISVPAVPRAWVTGTTLTNVTLHDTLAANMAATITDGENTYTPGVMARMSEAPFSLGWNDMRGCEARRVLGTARRRKPGVGK